MIPHKEWARMLALPGLLLRERAALSVLAWHWNGQDGPNHGRCDPAIPIIRAEMGAGEKTARRALDGLEDKGVIGRVLVKTLGSNKHHYWYFLRFMGQEVPEKLAGRMPPRGQRRAKGRLRTEVQWNPRPPGDQSPSVVTVTTRCGRGDHTDPPQRGQGDHTNVVRVTTLNASEIAATPGDTADCRGSAAGERTNRNNKGSEPYSEQAASPPAGGCATTTNPRPKPKTGLRTMEARYKSRCPLCKSKIYPGDWIIVNRGSKAAHAECPTPRDAAAPPSPGGGDGGYRFEDEEDFGEVPADPRAAWRGRS